jgi:hypothetical protein
MQKDNNRKPPFFIPIGPLKNQETGTLFARCSRLATRNRNKYKCSLYQFTLHVYSYGYEPSTRSRLQVQHETSTKLKVQCVNCETTHVSFLFISIKQTYLKVYLAGNKVLLTYHL